MQIRNDTVIKIGVGADRAVGFAAERLRHYIRLCTGFALRIRTDENTYGSEICVGNVRGGLIGAAEIASLKNDGVVYVVSEKGAHISSCSSRGVLYAVFEFLKNVLGFRFFAPDETVVPACGGELKPQRYSFSPPFEYRDISDHACYNREFGAANHLNGIFAGGPDEKYGGCYEFGGGFCHTLPKVFDPDKYFDRHPEYFALIDGERRKSPSQLCFSNPEIVEIAVEKVLEWKRARPDLHVFTLSQADGYHYCECEECRRISEREETLAAPMLTFINAVAKRVREEYPDIIIDTLAYLHTRKPPARMKLEKNVQIRLCSIECCCMHPIGKCDFYDARYHDKSYMPLQYAEDMEGWRKLTDRLFVWDYPNNLNNTLMPCPNLDVIAENVRFNRAHGVTGAFINSAVLSPYCSYAGVRNYLYARCMWDPDTDMAREYNEFMDAYYGKAGGKMKEAIRYLHERKKKVPLHMYFCSHIDKTEYYNAEFRRDYDKILREALALADSEKVAKRIRREMLAVPLLEIFDTPADDPQLPGKVDGFFAQAHELGIEIFRESDPGWSEQIYRHILLTKDWLFNDDFKFMQTHAPTQVHYVYEKEV